MFNNVVFPAPLGPITETISPRLTSILTWPIAWTPPKCLETPWILSSASVTMRVPRALHTRCCQCHASLGRPWVGYKNDLCQAIGSCNHGYAYPIPVSLQDGAMHTVHAYGIDTAGGNNPELSGGPKGFTCAPPALPAVGVHR